ncbi:MAG: trehalose-6-phosphate synthase, partial [Pollutimonas bauzanensis]
MSMIPFPSPSVLTTIPPHRALVEAMCAYDLLGFQTQTDVQAFVDYATRYLGAAVSGNEVKIGDRSIKVGAYPIGIHPDQIRALSKQSRRSKPLDALKSGLQHRKLIVSVDR